MKIDAHGAVREASAGGDFRAGHALDQSKNKSFAIAFGEREDGVESGAGFGGGVRRGWLGRRRRIVFYSTGFFDEFVERFAAAVEVGSAVAGDGGEPTGEFGYFAEGGGRGRAWRKTSWTRSSTSAWGTRERRMPWTIRA